MRRSLLEATTEDSVKAVWSQVYEQASGGDMVAAKLYLEMTCGRPVQAVEVSTSPDAGQISVNVILAKLTAAFADDPAARYKMAAALHSISDNPAAVEGATEQPANIAVGINRHEQNRVTALDCPL